MRVIRPVSREEVRTAFKGKAGTTWLRVSVTQQGYVCVSCKRIFYSDAPISYSLCDDDFARFNLWVITERMKGGYPSVQDWLAYRDVSKLKISAVPVGPVCKLSECPPGLFLFGDCLGLKTEYGEDEIFVVASGEAFWGGTETKPLRQNLKVVPCRCTVSISSRALLDTKGGPDGDGYPNTLKGKSGHSLNPRMINNAGP